MVNRTQHLSFAKTARQHPCVGTPDDIDNAVAFSASPAFGFINRQATIVDGGLFMQ